jgi:hypothetical protein
MTQESNKPVEMLACPFCGGVGRLRYDTYELDAGYHVVCHGNKNCPLYCSDPYRVFDTEAEAVTAWNTRLSSTPTADRNAVLEEARRWILDENEDRSWEAEQVRVAAFAQDMFKIGPSTIAALSRTTPVVTDEAVERMARAFYERGGFPNPTWDDLSERWKEFNRRGARAALATLGLAVREILRRES